MKEKYAKTDMAAAEILAITRQTFSARKNKSDFAVRFVPGKGWPISQLLDDDAKRKARDKRNLSGEHADRKGRKLDVEIEILELRRDSIRGELVPLDEYRRALNEVAGIVRWAAEQWPARVAVLTRDPAVTAAAETLRDQMLTHCREKAEAINEAPAATPDNGGDDAA